MTDGVCVRAATPSDGPDIAAIYAPYVMETAVSFETVAPDAAEMASRIANTLNQDPAMPGEPVPVAMLDGQP